MKIISWNVNGIRAVEKKGFTDWLLSCGADVVCIQETKASPDKLSKELIAPGLSSAEEENDAPLFAAALESEQKGAVYKSYFNSAKKPGYSGTAIYSLKEPDSVTALGESEFDDEGRTTIAFFGKTAVISAYFPNSQAEAARLDYKLRYCACIYEKCNELVSKGYDVVLCGDYNIAHTPADIANPKANEKNAGYLPEERAWMDFFTTHGYKDSFRLFCSEPGHYTWWSYRFNARAKDIGWRLDYLCVNESMVKKVKSSIILKDVTGSDHCPVAIEIE